METATVLKTAIDVTAATRPQTPGGFSGFMEEIGGSYLDTGGETTARELLPVLKNLAADLGYKFRYAELRFGELGHTASWMPRDAAEWDTFQTALKNVLGDKAPVRLPWAEAEAELPPSWAITLSRGMSMPSKFRVLCHELSHAILHHPPESLTQAISDLPARAAGGGENPAHEAAAELSAAAVCSLVKVGTGRFTPVFLAKTHITAAAKVEALEAATRIAEAVGRERGGRR